MKKLLSLLLVGSFLFVACSGNNIKNMSEKDRFINAVVEATCEAFEVGIMDFEAVEKKTKTIFEKYGFDSESEEEMLALQEKYANDIEEPLMEAFQKCAPQEFLDMISGFDLDLEEGEFSDNNTYLEGEDLIDFSDLDDLVIDLQ